MFLAGIATANLWSGRGGAPADPIGAYADLLTKEFDLSPKRVQALQKVLEIHSLEAQRIKDRHRSGPDNTLGKELDDHARSYAAMIRDKVLPPDQRERYDRMLAVSLQTLPTR